MILEKKTDEFALSRFPFNEYPYLGLYKRLYLTDNINSVRTAIILW